MKIIPDIIRDADIQHNRITCKSLIDDLLDNADETELSWWEKQIRDEERADLADYPELFNSFDADTYIDRQGSKEYKKGDNIIAFFPDLNDFSEARIIAKNTKTNPIQYQVVTLNGMTKWTEEVYES